MSSLYSSLLKLWIHIYFISFMLYFLITSHTCVTTIIIFIMIATIFSNFFLKYDCQVKLQHKAHIITCILKTKPENLIQRMQLYVLKRSIFKWNKTKVDHDLRHISSRQDPFCLVQFWILAVMAYQTAVRTTDLLVHRIPHACGCLSK